MTSCNKHAYGSEVEAHREVVVTLSKGRSDGRRGGTDSHIYRTTGTKSPFHGFRPLNFLHGKLLGPIPTKVITAFPHPFTLVLGKRKTSAHSGSRIIEVRTASYFLNLPQKFLPREENVRRWKWTRDRNRKKEDGNK